MKLKISFLTVGLLFGSLFSQNRHSLNNITGRFAAYGDYLAGNCSDEDKNAITQAAIQDARRLLLGIAIVGTGYGICTSLKLPEKIKLSMKGGRAKGSKKRATKKLKKRLFNLTPTGRNNDIRRAYLRVTGNGTKKLFVQVCGTGMSGYYFNPSKVLTLLADKQVDEIHVFTGSNTLTPWFFITEKNCCFSLNKKYWNSCGDTASKIEQFLQSLDNTKLNRKMPDSTHISFKENEPKDKSHETVDVLKYIAAIDRLDISKPFVGRKDFISNDDYDINTKKYDSIIKIESL